MKNFSNFTLTEVKVSTTKKSEIILCFKECLNNHVKYAGLKPKVRILFVPNYKVYKTFYRLTTFSYAPVLSIESFP